MDKKEKTVFEQTHVFGTLLDNIPHPVYYQDIHGFLLGYNQAFRELFDLGPHEDFTGKTIFDLAIPLQDSVNWHKDDLELFRTPGTRLYETYLNRPDSSKRNIIVKKSTFYLPDGTAEGIVGFVTDVSESVCTEDLSKEGELRFKALSEASLEGIVFVENGIITDANRRMYEIFGYEDEEITGREVPDFVAPEARVFSKERIATFNQERYETLGLKKDGTVFPISVYPRQISIKDKSLNIFVVRDLTTQKNMEAEVLKSKNIQSVGTLAGGVAHDFNNLLMAIIGNISLAKLHAPKGGKTVVYLKEAERLIFMGKDLTHQLLTFSHSVDTFKKVINIGPLLKETAEKLLGGSLVRLNFNIPEDLSRVEVDEDQMKQVIQNIIVNAMEAMQADGALYVSCENVRITPQHKLPPILEDYVRILIRDEGVGISEENLSKIFDPYFTTKDMGSQKGVGLGLAICYSIVKKHNGYILVDSIQNKGTTFQIYLPVHKQQPAAIPVEKKAAAGSKGSVLVVDDEEMVLKIAEKLLLHMGYEVAISQTSEEAISLYRESVESNKPFDVVILDLVMDSGMGGTEVLEQLKKIDADVKTIISSGYLHDPVLMNYADYGFAGILTKPYDPKELDEKLQAIING
ncbi:MAG TPA: PAS domain S-box protein [Syntrophorhabdaceae bacterium]|nr:PAS domain S-box protein [Syntrophorhabdaceae bacterium]